MAVRYAGKGVAFDCLSQKMRVPYIESYGYFNVKGGNVVCVQGTDERAGVVLAAVLVLLHLALLLGPLVMITIFSNRARTLRVQALDVIFVAMGVFSLSSFAEITQHIHDNWLYLGLIPSYNNAVFYGGLTAGQALLAWGIGGFGLHVIFNTIATVGAILSLILATVLTADAPNPTVAGVPIPVDILFFALTFLALTITTGDYLWQSFKQFKGFKLNLVLAVAVVLSYAAGVFFSVLVQFTGHQYFHVPTASGFVLGFVFQIGWILSATTAKLD